MGAQQETAVSGSEETLFFKWKMKNQQQNNYHLNMWQIKKRYFSVFMNLK
jgi:hypothetical protein